MSGQFRSGSGAVWRHVSVVEEMAIRHALSRWSAEALFDDLILFLSVAACAPVSVIPSPSIDDAWHAFILNTVDYAAYCDQHLGRFVHHRPTRPCADVAVTIAERDAAAKASGKAMAESVDALRPKGWPHHRAGALISCLSEPVIQDIVLTLLDDMGARRRYLESPLGWLGGRRAALDDEQHLTVYDFFGGGLRYLPEWPGVSDRVRRAALDNLFDGFPGGGQVEEAHGE